MPNVGSSGNRRIGFVLYQNDKFFQSKNYKTHFNHTKVISGNVANATVNDVKIVFKPKVSPLTNRTERERILENVTSKMLLLQPQLFTISVAIAPTAHNQTGQALGKHIVNDHLYPLSVVAAFIEGMKFTVFKML